MSELGTVPRLDGPDLRRMGAERLARLRVQMQAQGVDGAVLLGGPNVCYATGHVPVAVDASHANHRRAVAIVSATDGPARLHAHDPDGEAVATGAEAGDPLWPELDEGAAGVGAAIAEVLGDVTGRRVAVDAVTGAMARAGVLDGAELVDASRVVGAARVVKTADELDCIDQAQRQTERAMIAAQDACVPGASRAEVAGVFLGALRRGDTGPGLAYRSGIAETGSAYRSGIAETGSAYRSGIAETGSAYRSGIAETGSAFRSGIAETGSAFRRGDTGPGLAYRSGIAETGSAFRSGIAETGSAFRSGIAETGSAFRSGIAETGSAFRSGIAETGSAFRNGIDPIFQPMPVRRDGGPRTSTGHVAFPTGVDNPVFAEGDLVWVDAGVGCHGYMSDFGRTWVAGRDPTAAEQSLFDRWMAVLDASLAAVRPGATLGDIGRAARAVEPDETPWLPQFYLAHGTGLESAEMPMIGTDLGPVFDDGYELAAGMVLVFEPVVWTDGVGGYRAEEIVAVTDDGWRSLGGGHHYKPFRS